MDERFAAESGPTLRAGVAIGDLTPKPGVQLGGYPYVDRAATGVHDRLFAAALYLADRDGSAALLIVTDLFWITRQQADRIRHGIAGRSSLDPERIVVTCSHTHSAPWMSVVFKVLPGQPEFETDVDQEYVDSVVETCVDIGLTAMREVFEAQLGFTRTRCGAESGIGGNRRDPEQGVIDPELPILAVRDNVGRIRAVWTKYALHPTVLLGENTLVSADFPGAMRALLAERLPDAAFLYSMGTAGDQSPRYFRTGPTFEEVTRFGRTLGTAVTAALDDLAWVGGAPIRMATCEVRLPVKSYPPADQIAGRVAVLRAREQQLIASGASAADLQTANRWLLGAECDYLNALQAGSGELQRRYDAGVPYTVTCLAVGELAWSFLPGEVFCEFGIQIKRGSPFPETHVVTLANGDLPGYCVTGEALVEGGYEPGNSILDGAAGTVLVDAVVGLLEDLYADREEQ